MSFGKGRRPAVVEPGCRTGLSDRIGIFPGIFEPEDIVEESRREAGGPHHPGSSAPPVPRDSCGQSRGPPGRCRVPLPRARLRRKGRFATVRPGAQGVPGPIEEAIRLAEGGSGNPPDDPTGLPGAAPTRHSAARRFPGPAWRASGADEGRLPEDLRQPPVVGNPGAKFPRKGRFAAVRPGAQGVPGPIDKAIRLAESGSGTPPATPRGYQAQPQNRHSAARRFPGPAWRASGADEGRLPEDLRQPPVVGHPGAKFPRKGRFATVCPSAQGVPGPIEEAIRLAEGGIGNPPDDPTGLPGAAPNRHSAARRFPGPAWRASGADEGRLPEDIRQPPVVGDPRATLRRKGRFATVGPRAQGVPGPIEEAIRLAEGGSGNPPGDPAGLPGAAPTRRGGGWRGTVRASPLKICG